jgi:hypothetical protein
MTVTVPKSVAQPNAFRLNELKFDHYEPQTRFLGKKPGRSRGAGTSFSMERVIERAFLQAAS